MSARSFVLSRPDGLTDEQWAEIGAQMDQRFAELVSVARGQQ